MKHYARKFNELWRLVDEYDDYSSSMSALPVDAPLKDRLAVFSRVAKRRANFLASRLLRLFALLLLGAVVGSIAGLVGSAFLWGMNHASQLFLASEEAAAESGYPRLLFALPVVGVAIVALYSVARTSMDAGTNQVVEALVSEKKPSLLLAPLIFASSIMTQVCGGSAGREGAALQLGGCVGLGVGRALRFHATGLKMAIFCGMAGGFSAVFGAPLTAAFFAVEVGCVGLVYYPALLPSLVSAAVASGIAKSLGFAPFFCALPVFPSTSALLIARVLLLGLLCGLTSVFFCTAIRVATKSMARRFSNDYWRIIFGGSLVATATVLLGTNAYNGTGALLVERATQGDANLQDFALKILLTAATLGAGFKGGEIVPLLAVGSTFGCAWGELLGIEPSLGAALGMTALFCGATNCPIAALLLGMEFFGAQNALLFALACAATYAVSGRSGLYKSQKLAFSKASGRAVDADWRSYLSGEEEKKKERGARSGAGSDAALQEEVDAGIDQLKKSAGFARALERILSDPDRDKARNK